MSGYGASLIANGDTAVRVALLVFVPLLILFTLRVSAGLRTPLRTIAPWRALPRLSERSTETGEPVVLWLAGGLQDAAGPETAALATLYDYVSAQQARADQPAPLRTTHPVTLLLAMNSLQGNRERHQLSASCQPDEICFAGPAPLALASAVSADLRRDKRTATLLAGSFEAESLWCVASAPVSGPPLLSATADPAGAALTRLAEDALSGECALPGEDLFAAGAYLHRPLTLGSLLAEDWMRWLLIAIIVVAVLLTSAGYGG